MNKKVGLLLSGCGKLDGSEIHESVVTILALDRAGVEIVYMAPDIEFTVANHLTCEDTNERRSTLIESCRISRCEIENIENIKTSDIDALILPGGFGAAKNLCNFADKDADAVVHPYVEQLILKMNEHSKPIGAICIAPVVIAKILGQKNIKLTIGNDITTASAIEDMGCTHVDCAVDNIVTDHANKIVTTPAYMLGPSIKDIAMGIEKLVGKILSMT
ncbi:MAG: isoprenoid biosynthesis glyoxalase ElbB [Desulfobacteraceae bacterium]|nr:isoprenoid biosynthesis glyoxalase ElbB [Desulfobacteraceae bacterium]